MANRYLRQFVLTQDPKQAIIAGSFSLNSSAAVTATNFNGLVSSVTKTGTGEYTITLADKWYLLRSIQLTYQGTGDIVLRVKSADVSSAKTIVVETWDISAAAVANVSVASVIHMNVTLKDSTAK